MAETYDPRWELNDLRSEIRSGSFSGGVADVHVYRLTGIIQAMLGEERPLTPRSHPLEGDIRYTSEVEE